MQNKQTTKIKTNHTPFKTFTIMKNFRKNIAAVVAVAALSFVGAQSALASPVYASEAPVAETEAVVPNLATEAGTGAKQSAEQGKTLDVLGSKHDIVIFADGADDTAFDVEIHKIQANDNADTASLSSFWKGVKDWFNDIVNTKPDFGKPLFL